MACKCSPSLKRLMAAFAAGGHVDSGCCGDEAHQARVSDHNPDASGYAHAQDIHELTDHDMQPFVDFIMRNPGLFPQVKYLIYEGYLYYPHDGVRRAGRYVYTGPNPHASHLHVSIFGWATHYADSWHVDAAYGAPIAPEEDPDMPKYRLIRGHPDMPGHVFAIDFCQLTWVHDPQTAADMGIPVVRDGQGVAVDLASGQVDVLEPTDSIWSRLPVYLGPA